MLQRRMHMLEPSFPQAKRVEKRIDDETWMLSVPDWLELPRWGRLLSLLSLLFMYAFPVYAAYLLASWTQPHLDAVLLDPLRKAIAGMPEILREVFVGTYGLLTLGTYSFLWAFPVVFLIGVSVAVTEEMGIKDRITDALDPWMRKIGLNGRDLIPVLSGFGCNAIAVFQSRTCSACTRKRCVSLITYGSACSYQIGASLSLFGSAGKPWLFLPYLAAVLAAGILHTRLWFPAKTGTEPGIRRRAWIQSPSWKGVFRRVRAVVKQFLLQAMPIFLGICLVAALLDVAGCIRLMGWLVSPLMSLFQLPESAAPGLVFSILRKDGMLVFNQDGGSWIQSLSAPDLFVLVYLASTFTACLVTIWTVRKELGWKWICRMVFQQMVISTATAWIMSVVLHLFR